MYIISDAVYIIFIVTCIKDNAEVNLFFFLYRIKDIPMTAFQDLHSLEWIKLYNNRIVTLQYELMEPILDTLMHIDVHSE